MAATSQLKIKLLNDFVSMYASRIQVAKDYAKEYIRVATVTTVPIHGKIIPDMCVEYLERDEVLARLDTSKGGVSGAMAMIDGASDDEVPFGLIFDDGDALMMRMRIHRLDREDE
jgi:hypothetical protein